MLILFILHIKIKIIIFLLLLKKIVNKVIHIVFDYSTSNNNAIPLSQFIF